MEKLLVRKLNFVFVALLCMPFTAPRNGMAQSHVVSPAQIQKDVAASSAARQQNQEQMQSFLSSPEAQRALKSANINPQQVTNAVSQLNDKDLASLAARADSAQKDFAAGRISDRDLLIILVCIAALLVVIVAVH